LTGARGFQDVDILHSTSDFVADVQPVQLAVLYAKVKFWRWSRNNELLLPTPFLAIPFMTLPLELRANNPASYAGYIVADLQTGDF